MWIECGGSGEPFQGRIEPLLLSRLLRFEGGKCWGCCFAWPACVQGHGPCCKVCTNKSSSSASRIQVFRAQSGGLEGKLARMASETVDKSPSDKVTSHPSHSPLPIVLNPVRTISSNDGETDSHLVEPIFLEGVSRSC